MKKVVKNKIFLKIIYNKITLQFIPHLKEGDFLQFNIKNAINIIIRKYNAPWLISKQRQEACKQFIQNLNDIINE